MYKNNEMREWYQLTIDNLNTLINTVNYSTITIKEVNTFIKNSEKVLANKSLTKDEKLFIVKQKHSQMLEELLTELKYL